MRIVKIAPTDWPSYQALRLESLRLEPLAFGSTYASTLSRSDEWWIHRLERALVNPNETLLFALDGGNYLGMVGAYPAEEPGVTNVISMYVTPAARGKGIGRRLLQAVVDELRDQSPTPIIQLAVNSDQTAALALYRNFGFGETQREELVRADGTPYLELTMRLP